VRITLSSVMVDDQDKALAFYTDVLGFVKEKDVPVDGPYRWITVVSPLQPGGPAVSLEPNAYPPAKTFQEALFGSGIPWTAFAVDDIRREYERLKALGVAFHTEPTEQFGQTVAVFDDTCGNLIQIYQG
jgi:catechol 2,3-dioxygenase-like lactoylglutathione lyase family enzyme